MSLEVINTRRNNVIYSDGTFLIKFLMKDTIRNLYS